MLSDWHVVEGGFATTKDTYNMPETMALGESMPSTSLVDDTNIVGSPISLAVASTGGFPPIGWVIVNKGGSNEEIVQYFNAGKTSLNDVVLSNIHTSGEPIVLKSMAMLFTHPVTRILNTNEILASMKDTRFEFDFAVDEGGTTHLRDFYFGVINRYQDDNNYYDIRISVYVQDSDVIIYWATFYKMINSVLTRVAYTIPLEVVGQINEPIHVIIDNIGDLVTITVGGQLFLTASDSDLTLPGKVGWKTVGGQYYDYYQHIRIDKLKIHKVIQ